MKKVQTAIVGLGRIGWMLESDPLRYHPCTHAGSMLQLKDRFSIVAGCDTDADRCRQFSRYLKRHGEKAVLFSKVDELSRSIRDGSLSVDLAVIATGPESHSAILEHLLKSGVRRFLIEKPVALDARSARRMNMLALNYDATVHVNFERRYHPAYRLVRRLIANDRLGELRHIEGRVLAPSLRRDALLEDAVHWIDLMLWYCGEPESVRSSFRLDSKDRERGSLHVFHFENFDAVLESGGMRRYFEFLMRLDFDRGRIIAGNDGHFHFKSSASAKYRGFYDLKPVPVKLSQKEQSENSWLALYREIAGGRDCRSSLAGAVTGIEWIDRCRRFR